MPNLNIARQKASACFLENAVYVLGGVGEDDECLSSVEKLQISGRVWEILHLASN